MSQPSNDLPVNIDGNRRGVASGHDRQCSAHRKNGDRCRKFAIRGAVVCRVHGGAARHVKLAAKARLENAADRMARQLLGIAVDDDMPPAVRLAAIKDALDRAGLAPNAKVAVELEVKPFETLLSRIIAGPRSEGAPTIGDAPLVIEGAVDEPPSCADCGLPFPAELPPHLDHYPPKCQDCRGPGDDDGTQPRRTPSWIPAQPTANAAPAKPSAPTGAETSTETLATITEVPDPYSSTGPREHRRTPG